jgi:uncharacterized membrane protein YoaK (UPF0700 family)
MFRHQGNSRTFIHNLRLATLLSFVSGIVNVCGLFAFGVLTTNVTGHFAFFSEELVRFEYKTAIVFLLFTLCFLAGAFISNFLSTLAYQRNKKNPHFYPIVLEIVLISMVGFSTFQENSSIISSKLFTFSLLMAMGIQNALVTYISKSVVRTTHLTGLFTDLGIDISQLLFNKTSERKISLLKNIFLKFSIILFFSLGCILGGYLFRFLNLKTLLIASLFLIIALYFDFLRYRYFILKRKIKGNYL